MLRSRRVSNASHDATCCVLVPMMSHGPFWSNALRGGRPRHFQPLGIEPLMKASIRNRMAPQAPRKQWLACRDQWIKGARPDSACRFHFSARLCPIVEMRWLSQTGHFDCRKNMKKKNMRKDWIWRYSMFWKRLGFAVLCRAVLLGWFKINAGRRFDRYRTEPWSKAQEEARSEERWLDPRHESPYDIGGPGGLARVWAAHDIITAIACHSQIRILGITSGQIWLVLRLRFFRICGDQWSWKAGRDYALPIPIEISLERMTELKWPPFSS